MARKGPSSALGIYLSDRSLRLTLLTGEGKKLFLDEMRYFPLPSGSLIHEIAVDKQWNDSIDWFKATLGKRNFKADKTVFSFGGGPIFVKTLPALRHKVKNKILLEVEHSLCSPIEDYVFDFYSWREMALVAGARRKFINAFEALFRDAGITLAAVDASPFALFNLAKYSGILPAKETIAILCVEESFALVVVIQETGLLWTENLLYPVEMVLKSRELNAVSVFAQRLCSRFLLSLNKQKKLFSSTGALGIPFEPKRVLLGGILAEVTKIRDVLSSRLKCPVDIIDPFVGLITSRLNPEKNEETVQPGALPLVLA